MMYSGTVKYRVYKKDITHYRVEVFNPFTNEWTELTKDCWPEKLTLINCKMVIDEMKLKQLQEKDAPVCAWIECEAVLKQFIPQNRTLYFNPYKVDKFVDRMTMLPVNRCNYVSMNGNLVTYK